MRQFARAFWEKLGLNLGDLLIILGIIAISAPLLWSIRSSYLQEMEARKWSQQTKQSVEPEPDSRADGPLPWPPTKILIDKLDLSAIVVEGKSNKDLDRGPVHVAGTANPGQPGNCCIAAHKEKWFKHLRKLEPGDTVILKTHQNQFNYIVIGQQTVKPDNLKALEPKSSRPVITLITCTGLPYGGSKHRLLVVGKLKE